MSMFYTKPINGMHCNCAEQMDEHLAKQDAENGRKPERGLDVRCLTLLSHDILFEVPVLTLINPETKRVKKGYFKMNFCPFCGKPAKTQEEIIAEAEPTP